jgi:hypothetical protein
MQTHTTIRPIASTLVPGPRADAATRWHADDGASHAPTIWHDDLLGDSWSPPAEGDDDDETTLREIESLVGELVAQLEA